MNTPDFISKLQETARDMVAELFPNTPPEVRVARDKALDENIEGCLSTDDPSFFFYFDASGAFCAASVCTVGIVIADITAGVTIQKFRVLREPVPLKRGSSITVGVQYPTRDYGPCMFLARKKK